MDKLESALRRLENSDNYPFHMPGHKRQPVIDQLKKAYAWDITEIDGFDNLHHPEGLIKEEQEFAKKLFGAQESFFIVNGSSGGVLGALTSLIGRQDADSKILMGRNSHRSAYNALFLTDMEADYLYPERIPGLSFAGEISVARVEAALQSNDTYAGIFLTSPTYEGIISDIEGICNIAHQKNIPVIVDEAHGAHLGIWGGDGYFPPDALAMGADVVIQSLHKTLPAMTQTAMVHVQGDLIDRQKLKMGLSMFQSSSPSYILMESMISCLHYCEEHKKELEQHYRKNLETFYQETNDLCCIKIWTAEKINNAAVIMDPGKLVIGTGNSGLTGRQLYDILREKYHLQLEMAAADYVIAMTSVMDTTEGFERLLYALKEIDRTALQKGYEVLQVKPPGKEVISPERPETVYQIRDAFQMTGESIPIEESGGRISQEYVCLYPPGIPLIVPGERIPPWLPGYLEQSARLGLNIEGLKDDKRKAICCIANM